MVRCSYVVVIVDLMLTIMYIFVTYVHGVRSGIY